MTSLLEHCPSEERMMETMIPPQVGMRLWMKKKERKDAIKKRKGPNKKMREKERRDNVTILLPHLCFKVAP